MKRLKFSEEQIIRVLKEAEAGARPASWRATRGVGSSDLQLEGQVWRRRGCRRRSGCARLEDENMSGCLRDSVLDNAALKDLLTK